MIAYDYYPYIFDIERFGEDVKRAVIRSGCLFKEIEEMLGTSNMVTAIASGGYARHNTMPSMRNFLEICNLLELDPHDYFVIQLRDDNGG